MDLPKQLQHVAVPVPWPKDLIQRCVVTVRASVMGRAYFIWAGIKESEALCRNIYRGNET